DFRWLINLEEQLDDATQRKVDDIYAIRRHTDIGLRRPRLVRFDRCDFKRRRRRLHANYRYRAKQRGNHNQRPHDDLLTPREAALTDQSTALVAQESTSPAGQARRLPTPPRPIRTDRGEWPDTQPTPGCGSRGFRRTILRRNRKRVIGRRVPS